MVCKECATFLSSACLLVSRFYVQRLNVSHCRYITTLIANKPIQLTRMSTQIFKKEKINVWNMKMVCADVLRIASMWLVLKFLWMVRGLAILLQNKIKMSFARHDDGFRFGYATWAMFTFLTSFG